MSVISSNFQRRRRFASTAAFALAASAASSHSAQARPDTFYNVNLNGSILGNPFASNIYIDGQQGLSNYNLNLTTGLLRADAGDINTNWGELGFASSNFQGLALGAPIGKVETTLIGGNVVVYDPLGQQRVSPVYGLRAAMPIGSKFSLNASQLFTPGGAGKSLSSAGLDYQLRKDTRLGAELATSGGGYGGLISAERIGERFSLAASYRRVDTNFSTGANPNLLTERNGLFANVRYLIARPLTFELQHRDYTDGFGGHSKGDSAFLNYAIGKRTSLSLFSRSQDTQSRDLNLVRGLNFTGQSTGVQVSHSFRSAFLSLGYDRFKFSSALASSGSAGGGLSAGQTTNRLNANVVYLLNRRTKLSLQHTLTLGTGGGANGNPQSSYTAFEVNRALNNKGLGLTLGFDHQTSGFASESGQSLAARIGATFPTGKNGSIGMLLRTPVASSGSRGFSSPAAVYLTFSRKIQIGRAPTSTRLNALGLSSQERRQLGKINGRVFEDQNENGLWDINEPGIPDVKMSISSLQQPTGENGQFTLSDLPPAPYQLQMVVKTLPIDLAILGPTQATVNVKPGKPTTIDFPVVRTGQVQGIVFDDTNRNGQQDVGELPIADALVRVEDSDVVSFTDKKGNFALYNLPPKTWKVSVDTEALTQDIHEFESTGAGSLSIAVKPNGNITGVQLGVVEKERAVVIEPLAFTTTKPASPTPEQQSKETISPGNAKPAALPQVAQVSLNSPEFLGVHSQPDGTTSPALSQNRPQEVQGPTASIEALKPLQKTAPPSRQVLRIRPPLAHDGDHFAQTATTQKSAVRLVVQAKQSAPHVAQKPTLAAKREGQSSNVAGVKSAASPQRKPRWWVFQRFLHRGFVASQKRRVVSAESSLKTLAMITRAITLSIEMPTIKHSPKGLVDVDLKLPNGSAPEELQSPTQDSARRVGLSSQRVGTTSDLRDLSTMQRTPRGRLSKTVLRRN